MSKEETKEIGNIKVKTDRELQELGIRGALIEKDQSIFKKTKEEREQLKQAKKHHKELIKNGDSC